MANKDGYISIYKKKNIYLGKAGPVGGRIPEPHGWSFHPDDRHAGQVNQNLEKKASYLLSTDSNPKNIIILPQRRFAEALRLTNRWTLSKQKFYSLILF